LITATNYGVFSARLCALHHPAHTDLSPSLNRAGKRPEPWLRAQVLLVQALPMRLALTLRAQALLLRGPVLMGRQFLQRVQPQWL
jgi:hypothetical protein